MHLKHVASNKVDIRIEFMLSKNTCSMLPIHRLKAILTAQDNKRVLTLLPSTFDRNKFSKSTCELDRRKQPGSFEKQKWAHLSVSSDPDRGLCGCFWSYQRTLLLKMNPGITHVYHTQMSSTTLWSHHICLCRAMFPSTLPCHHF